MNTTILTVGPAVLSGRVTLAGAKNSALRLLAASILSRGKVELRNYPSQLLDAQVHVGMLEALGKSVTLTSSESVTIEENRALETRLNWDGRSIRNTLLILGALTTRLGAGAVPLPGGCRLGDRKFDIHITVLESLGARVWDDDSGYLYAEAPAGGLRGNDIHLRIRSTGATENAILAASLANGVSRIWNPHIRPEILDLISMLNAMGAQITVHGQEHIEVVGVRELAGVQHTVIPDSMEAVTWLAAAGISGGDIEIANFPNQDLDVVLTHLTAAGARIYRGEDSVIVRGSTCYPLEISTGPHPGINSDVQPILAAWAARARGESRIVDLRFPGRYGYAEEMARMGVASRVVGDALHIDGRGGGLVGAEVTALDLRAGAALALCALMSEGETVIKEGWQIARGYVDFAEKMTSLGGRAQWS